MVQVLFWNVLVLSRVSSLVSTLRLCRLVWERKHLISRPLQSAPEDW